MTDSTLTADINRGRGSPNARDKLLTGLDGQQELNIVFLPKHRVTIKLLWIFPPKFYWFWARRFLSIVISCWCKKRKFVIFVKIHSSIIPCKCPLNLFRNSNPVLIHWCWITLINTCCRRVKTIINIIFEEIGVTIAVSVQENGL